MILKLLLLNLIIIINGLPLINLKHLDLIHDIKYDSNDNIHVLGTYYKNKNFTLGNYTILCNDCDYDVTYNENIPYTKNNPYINRNHIGLILIKLDKEFNILKVFNFNYTPNTPISFNNFEYYNLDNNNLPFILLDIDNDDLISIIGTFYKKISIDNTICESPESNYYHISHYEKTNQYLYCDDIFMLSLDVDYENKNIKCTGSNYNYNKLSPNFKECLKVDPLNFEKGNIKDGYSSYRSIILKNKVSDSSNNLYILGYSNRNYISIGDFELNNDNENFDINFIIKMNKLKILNVTKLILNSSPSRINLNILETFDKNINSDIYITGKSNSNKILINSGKEINNYGINDYIYKREDDDFIFTINKNNLEYQDYKNLGSNNIILLKLKEISSETITFLSNYYVDKITKKYYEKIENTIDTNKYENTLGILEFSKNFEIINNKNYDKNYGWFFDYSLVDSYNNVYFRGINYNLSITKYDNLNVKKYDYEIMHNDCDFNYNPYTYEIYMFQMNNKGNIGFYGKFNNPEICIGNNKVINDNINECYSTCYSENYYIVNIEKTYKNFPKFSCEKDYYYIENENKCELCEEGKHKDNYKLSLNCSKEIIDIKIKEDINKENNNTENKSTKNNNTENSNTENNNTENNNTENNNTENNSKENIKLELNSTKNYNNTKEENIEEETSKDIVNDENDKYYNYNNINNNTNYSNNSKDNFLKYNIIDNNVLIVIGSILLLLIILLVMILLKKIKVKNNEEKSFSDINTELDNSVKSEDEEENINKKFLMKNISICILAMNDFIFDIIFILTVNSLKYYYISLIIILVSLFIGLIITSKSLIHIKSKNLIDINLFVEGKFSILYTIIVILSITKLDIMILLPYENRDYKGFPDKLTLSLTLLTVILEDLPQILTQLFYMIEINKIEVVPLLSLISSFIYLLVISIHRLIFIIFKEDNK